MTSCAYQRLLEERLSLISQYELVLTRERKCEIAIKIKQVEDKIREVGKLTGSFFDAVPGARRCLRCQ